MDLVPSYSLVLVVAALAALILIAVFAARKRWTPQPTQLRRLLSRKSLEDDTLHIKYLVPLLIYEEQYPSFVEIVGVVCQRFPISRFLDDDDFRSALSFLISSPYHEIERPQLRSAMARVVKSVLEDPDVEYVCRPHLAPLVDSFLREIEAEDEP